MVLDTLKRLVAERVEDSEVAVFEVSRNNSVKYNGMAIRVGGKSGSALVPIDQIAEEVKAGRMSPERAADWIVEKWQMLEKEYEVCQGYGIRMSKQYILDNVKVRMVNWRDNKDSLADAPCRRILDLCQTYRCEVLMGENYRGTFLVDNKVMEAHNISIDELEMAATRNCNAEGYAVQIFGTDGATRDIDSLSNWELMTAPMIILTSRSKVDGARVILRKDVIRRLADRVGSDLYILPSSIHEVLALRKSTGDADVLKEIVMSVNATVVAPDDILSNSVYYFDRESDELRIA